MQKATCNEPILGLSEALAGELVYRLCLAECARLGFRQDAVTRFERSTLKGGLHIRICLPTYANVSRYIPNQQTLICVRASYIPLNHIKQHIVQSEYLDAFNAERGAVYILASTRQTLNNSSAVDYQRYIQDSISNQACATKALGLDPHFYSRETLEAWLIEQPTVQSWLKGKCADTVQSFRANGLPPSNVIYSARLQRSP